MFEFKSLRGARTLARKNAARLIRNKRKLEAARRIPFSGYFSPGAPILPPTQQGRTMIPPSSSAVAALASVMAFYDRFIEETRHA